MPPEGATIDGYELPGGTLVGVNTWVLHRNTEIFGRDVNVFRAERWLEADKEVLQGMKQNLFTVSFVTLRPIPAIILGPLYLLPPHMPLSCGIYKICFRSAKRHCQFGAGPRMCIGRNIAMMQIGKLVAEFYRRFEARLAYPEKEWTVNGGWVCSQSDMDMIVALRKRESSDVGE